MNKCIYDHFRSFFPIEVEKELVRKLVDEWRRGKEHIHIYHDTPPDKPSYPLYISIGVIAGDWPGFSEAVLGTIHERGWNLSYISGLSQEVEGSRLGIIIVVIKIEDKKALKKFLTEREEIIKNLRSTSIDSLAKRLLISIESKRLEIYSKVVDIIEREAKKKELKALLGPDGEAFMFFASRSEAYIRERSPEDLADQIINNHRVQKDVVKSKGEIQIYIKNLKTTKENLTGITVGIFEKDMLLKEILDSISFALPYIRILYNKEFTTPEGVLVVRVEISDAAGNAYPPSYHERIKRVLERLHKKTRSESGKVLETTGGFEHYLRAIIPHLVREFNNTGIPQVFFSVMASSEFFLEFKIIVVSDKKDKEKKVARVLEGFDRVDGLMLLSIHPPKTYGNVIVNIFDVRGDLDKFDSSMALYDGTKGIIKQAIGEFRDFDEGLRKTDTGKLQSIMENLHSIPEKEIKRIYYSLEDFWRMSASISNLTKIIELTYNELGKYKKGEIMLNYIELLDGTAIVIASPKDKSFAGKVLNICRGCEITLSSMERPAANILLAFVSHDGKPLSKDKLSELTSKINP